MKICFIIAIVAALIGFALFGAAGNSLDSSANPGEVATMAIEGGKAAAGGLCMLIAFFAAFAGCAFWKAR